MTDDGRIARLTQLARKAWPHLRWSEDGGESRVFAFPEFAAVMNHQEQNMASIAAHPLSAQALEAALCVLAGEPPQWAVELAASWRRNLELGVERDAVGTAHAEAVLACAHELLAAAKGKP